MKVIVFASFLFATLLVATALDQFERNDRVVAPNRLDRLDRTDRFDRLERQDERDDQERKERRDRQERFDRLDRATGRIEREEEDRDLARDRRTESVDRRRESRRERIESRRDQRREERELSSSLEQSSFLSGVFTLNNVLVLALVGYVNSMVSSKQMAHCWHNIKSSLIA